MFGEYELVELPLGEIPPKKVMDMTDKQYTKEEAEALREKVLTAAREAKEQERIKRKDKHYHRKPKKYRMKVVVPKDGDLKKWLLS